MVDDYMLEQILNQLKETIVNEKNDDSKILIEADDKFPYNISLIKCCGINEMCYQR